MKSMVTFCFVIAIAIPTVAVYAQPAAGSRENTEHQKLAKELFRELVEINTTVTMGSTKAAEAIAARLKAAGLAAEDVQLLGPKPQHMNLVARHRGKSNLQPLLLNAHLDVVEALRLDWSLDPSIFLEQDGNFYGRGTTDDKCDDVALISALVRLRKEGFVPNCDIIVAFTEDEENGDANGVEWLLANHRDLIDAEYCIYPDGGGGRSSSPRTRHPKAMNRGED